MTWYENGVAVRLPTLEGYQAALALGLIDVPVEILEYQISSGEIVAFAKERIMVVFGKEDRLELSNRGLCEGAVA